MNPETLIRDALRRLLERNASDSFLVVDLVGSDGFVQFAGSEEGSLLLDLPTQPLDAGQLFRAEELFQEQGVELERLAVLDRPGGKRVGTQPTFQLPLGEDVERGAALALRVLREVYLAPDDLRISLEEN